MQGRQTDFLNAVELKLRGHEGAHYTSYPPNFKVRVQPSADPSAHSPSANLEPSSFTAELRRKPPHALPLASPSPLFDPGGFKNERTDSAGAWLAYATWAGTGSIDKVTYGQVTDR